VIVRVTVTDVVAHFSLAAFFESCVVTLWSPISPQFLEVWLPFFPFCFSLASRRQPPFFFPIQDFSGADLRHCGLTLAVVDQMAFFLPRRRFLNLLFSPPLSANFPVSLPSFTARYPTQLEYPGRLFFRFEKCICSLLELRVDPSPRYPKVPRGNRPHWVHAEPVDDRSRYFAVSIFFSFAARFSLLFFARWPVPRLKSLLNQARERLNLFDPPPNSLQEPHFKGVRSYRGPRSKRDRFSSPPPWFSAPPLSGRAFKSPAPRDIRQRKGSGGLPSLLCVFFFSVGPFPFSPITRWMAALFKASLY